MQRRLLILIILLVVISLLAVSSPAHTQAQDGLSGEEQANLDRALAALQNADETYSAYRLQYRTLDRFEISLYLEGQFIAADAEVLTTFAALQVLHGEQDTALQGEYFIERTRRAPDIEESTLVQGQVRRVDGTVYLENRTSTVTGPSTDTPGWQIVTAADSADYPYVDLTPYLTPDSAAFYQDYDAIRTNALSVETNSTPTGTESTAIFILVDAAPFIPATMTGDPLVEAMYDEMQFIIQVNLNEDGSLKSILTDRRIQVQQFDLYTASPDAFPAGMTADANVAYSTYEEYTSINADLSPITAPEGVTDD